MLHQGPEARAQSLPRTWQTLAIGGTSRRATETPDPAGRDRERPQDRYHPCPYAVLRETCAMRNSTLWASQIELLGEGLVSKLPSGYAIAEK